VPSRWATSCFGAPPSRCAACCASCSSSEGPLGSPRASGPVSLRFLSLWAPRGEGTTVLELPANPREREANLAAQVVQAAGDARQALARQQDARLHARVAENAGHLLFADLTLHLGGQRRELHGDDPHGHVRSAVASRGRRALELDQAAAF